MKYFFLSLLLLAGCSGSGGSAAKASDNTNPPPSCKPLLSEWTSDTDQETHDFSLFVVDSSMAEYKYTGPDGALCGFAMPSGVNSFKANIITQSVSADPEFTHLLQFYGEDVVANSCNNWQQQTPPNDPHGWAHMKLSCNALKMCYQVAGGELGCKTFH